MLAQNFKTAADLGLEESHRDALIRVLGMLERGEISYNKEGDHLFGPKDGKQPKAFNMQHVYGEAECGTVCCLAGWAEFVGQIEPYSLFKLRRDNEGLAALFDPYFGHDFSIREIKPAEAAMALRSFLTTGDPDWNAAIGREPQR